MKGRVRMNCICSGGAKPEPGEMPDMQLTTPIIEIIDDLKTAKCVWWMPGAGAIPKENERNSEKK